MSVNLEIESVFKITNRGHYVIAKLVDPKQIFYITKKSFLDGIELAEYFDIPRSLDENGDQRDIVLLHLKNPEDATKLIPNSIVELIPGDKLHLLEPWHLLVDPDPGLGQELYKEISKNHILYGEKVNAIARRQDNDDVLFELVDRKNKYAIVHLTWKSKIENDSGFPRTEIFNNWLDLYNERIVADHDLFNS
ncbi:MAG TPA: hypothetical protein VL307_04105 [Chitinophagaceae bacterium]|nr:hypothetical protein [Chitinophagaceae bacterium]